MAADYDRYLRARGYGHLVVPEAAVEPLTGATDWSPRHEGFSVPAGRKPPRAPGSCWLCGGVPEGSDSWCPACGSSGHEEALAAQRALTPAPPPDPRPRGDDLAGGTGDNTLKKRSRGRPRKSAA